MDFCSMSFIYQRGFDFKSINESKKAKNMTRFARIIIIKYELFRHNTVIKVWTMCNLVFCHKDNDKLCSFYIMILLQIFITVYTYCLLCSAEPCTSDVNTSIVLHDITKNHNYETSVMLAPWKEWCSFHKFLCECLALCALSPLAVRSATSLDDNHRHLYQLNWWFVVFQGLCQVQDLKNSYRTNVKIKPLLFTKLSFKLFAIVWNDAMCKKKWL